MRERIEYFDFLRGVAIIFVITIHVSSSYFNSVGILGSSKFDFNILLTQLVRCAVPLFLAISGYFMAQKKFAVFHDYKSFVKKQLLRVYLPCLVWSLPYLALSLLKGNHTPFFYVLWYLSCGFSVYYFIALIMQFYIFLPFLQKIATIPGITISFLISALTIYILQIIKYHFSYHLPLILYAGPFFMWFVYFIIGLYFGNQAIKQSSNQAIKQSSNQAIKQSSNQAIWVLFLLSGIFLFMEYIESRYFVERYCSTVGYGNRKFSWLLYSSSIVYLSFLLRDKYVSNTFTRFVSLVGEFSFGIYLTHIFWLMIIGRINLQLNWLLEVPLVLFLSMIPIYLGRKYFPVFSRKYLGF